MHMWSSEIVPEISLPPCISGLKISKAKKKLQNLHLNVYKNGIWIQVRIRYDYPVRYGIPVT